MKNEKIKHEDAIIAEDTTAESTTKTAEPGTDDKRNVLLGTISYTDENDYDKFLQSLDLNQSLFVLIASAKYCQSKGAFSLDESELVAKAIKTIKKNTAKPVEKQESKEETSK